MKKLDIKDVEEVTDLLPQQMGMLLLYLKDKKSNRNLEQLTVDFVGTIDEKRLRQSLVAIIKRHPMLRAVYRWEAIKMPVQIILREASDYIQFIDCSVLDTKDRSEEVSKWIELDALEQFDLQERAFCFTCIKLQEKCYKLLITMHHIICDGWSTSVILQELLKGYGTDGKDNEILQLDTSHRTYQNFIKSLNEEPHKLFWKNYLKGADSMSYNSFPNTELPCKGEVYHMSFSQEETKKLYEETKILNMTLASLFYFCWGETLMQLLGQSEFIYYTTMSTRINPEFGDEMNQSVGMYINTVPIVARVSDALTVTERMEELSSQLKKCLNYIYLPVDNMNAANGYPQTLVVFENYPMGKLLEMQGQDIGISGVEISQNSGFDLTIMITDWNQLEIHCFYNSNLLSEELIQEIINQYKKMLIDVSNGNELLSSKSDHITRTGAKLQELYASNDKGHAFMASEGIMTETEYELQEIWSQILKIPKQAIGKSSDFFQLSAHSLDAVSMAVQIEKRRSISIGIGKIYELSKLSSLAENMDRTTKNVSVTIKRTEYSDKLRASSEQKRIYLIQEMNPESICYNVYSAYRCKGKVNAEKFREVFQSLLDRHEALRTSFYEEGESIVQHIHSAAQLPFCYKEINGYSSEEIEAEIKSLVRPFDLKREILFRISLLRTGEEDYVLVVDMHHIISDGVSSGILIGDFMKLYQGETLAPNSYQYRDYSEWQNSKEYSKYISNQKNYWLSEFEDRVLLSHIPYDFNRSGSQEEGRQIYFTLEKEEVLSLREIALSYSVSLFHVLLSCFYLMLYKLTGKTEIVVGVPVANRRHSEFEAVIGMFVNTLPIKLTFEEKESFQDILIRLSKKMNAALDNQEYQLDQLYEELASSQKGKFKLFHESFLLQNMHIPKLQMGDISIEELPLKKDTTKFDLIFIGTEHEESITYETVYTRKYFKQETVEYAISIYKKIVSSIAREPNRNISSIFATGVESRTDVFSESLE